MTDDKAALLPCPFCGGAAKTGFSEPMRGCHNGEAWVECEACELTMYAHSRSEGNVPAAIAAWNTRALLPALAERGRTAIHRMLDMIGDGDATDHDIARVLVDAELDIRAFADVGLPTAADVRGILGPTQRGEGDDVERVARAIHGARYNMSRQPEPYPWDEEHANVQEDFRGQARAAIAALLRSTEGWKPTHQHYKGGLYQVLHEATDEYGQWKVIVYKAEDGRIWTRQKHVFEEMMPDGRRRFEPLTAAPSPGAEQATSTTQKETNMQQMFNALKALAELPIGAELYEADDHREIVLYQNAGRSITVGDVLDARDAIRALKATSTSTVERDQRQQRVAGWCMAAFGAEQTDSIEQRGIRLLEEAIEAYQACGASADMARKMVDYIFARPAGTVEQELGGVGVTTLALANAAGLSADLCEAKEVARVLAKPLSHFTARNQAKNDAGFAAPASTAGERHD